MFYGHSLTLVSMIFMVSMISASVSPGIDATVEPAPILVLPGLLGSIINAKSGTETCPNVCRGHLTSEYARLWTRLYDIFNIKCFRLLTILKINHDASSYTPAYIETAIPEDGIFATSYLDPSNIITRHATLYLANFYQYLKNHGYILYKTIDTVAYDWRRSPFDFRQPGDYFDRIKERVERMYTNNGNRPVTLIGHSMGGATGALFLSTHVDANWKAMYIKQFISVAGVYAGAVKALASTISGTSDFLSSTLTDVISTFPGVHSLIPIPASLLPVWKDHVLFRIGSKSYTTDDIPELYRDVGITEYEHLVDPLRSVGYFTPPGVRVHCLYSTSIHTIHSVTSRSASEYDLKRSTFEMGPGDGTVPARSLEVCSSWSSKQSEPVYTELVESSHGKIIKNDARVWDYIYTSVNGYAVDVMSTESELIDSEDFFLSSPDVFMTSHHEI